MVQVEFKVISFGEIKEVNMVRCLRYFHWRRQQILLNLRLLLLSSVSKKIDKTSL